MSYFHGVRASEIPTAIIPPVRLDSPAVVIGAAPVHMSLDGVGKTNVPVLCYTYKEAASALGYSADWANYSLCEAMYTFFALYSVAPVVFVNVLDPATHKTSVASESVGIGADDKATLTEFGALPGSVVIKNQAGDTTYELDKDYILSFDDDEKLVITRVESGTIEASATLTVSYDKLDPSLVQSTDIVGGYDVATGKYTGLELVEQVFPKFRLVPGMLLAPGWSQDSSVASVMAAKTRTINSVFKSIALVDIPVDTNTKYSDAPSWKTTNNFVHENMITCWPKIKLGNAVYHLSTQVAALMMQVDAGNEGIPYISPSNHLLQMDGATIGDTSEGNEVNLTLDQANYLNSQGIVTALNFVGGWKCWGNRTATYPGVTDAKDSFIPVKRMFYWKANQLIMTYWQKVDAPTNRRLIETIVDSENINLNGLAARGILVGNQNRVEFRTEENPLTDLIDGIVRFHLFMTPPIPARDIEWLIEYDVSNLSSLFD